MVAEDSFGSDDDDKKEEVEKEKPVEDPQEKKDAPEEAEKKPLKIEMREAVTLENGAVYTGEWYGDKKQGRGK